MSNSKTVPRQFAADFDTVASHYKLRELGQYDEAKAAARADLDNAIVCFRAMAAELENEK